MVRYLDKNNETGILGELFKLLQQNMETVAPVQEHEAEWVACVAEALKKPPRQMLLLYAGDTLAGFCMYYINGDLLMVEEMQIDPFYQKTVQAAELFRFIRRNLLPRVRRIEAYAHSRNAASQRMMKKLGMMELGDDEKFLHFRGDVSQI